MFRFDARHSPAPVLVDPAPHRVVPHPDLLTLLEAEPAVVAYSPRPDGLVDVHYWGGRVLVGTLPAFGSGRLRVEQLKRQHQRDGRRVVLVPEARLARRPFSANRRMIAAAAGKHLDADEQLRVLDAVDDAGSVALGDLVRMLGTHAAAAGILALVSNGTLRIELSKPIDVNSIVHRFEA